MGDRNFSSIQYVPANPPQFQEKRRPVATSNSHSSGRKENESPLVFALRWTCLVLTVAATIVFGIWAPLSYKATVDSNNDGNVAQSSAMSVASAANDLASSRNDMASHANDIARTANSFASYASKVANTALSIASSQSSVLDAVQTRIAAMGQLWLVDFCASRSTLSACSSYFGTLNFNALASSLAAAIPPPAVSEITFETSETAAPTSTTELSAPTSTPLPTSLSAPSSATMAAPSSAPAATSSSAPAAAPSSTPTVGATPEGSTRGTGIPVAAILGIVFGFVGTVGALAGVVVWRYRQNHLS